MNKLREQTIVSSTPIHNKVLKPTFRKMSGEVSAIAQTMKTSKPFLDMICEAIGTVGLPRKGASYQKIQSYILKNYSDGEQKRAKTLIKKSLLKGLETGVLSRSAASKLKSGAIGHFVLNKVSSTAKKTNAQKAPAKASGLKTKKAEEKKPKPKPEKHLSDTEISINKASKKKEKLYSSDSEMPDKVKINPKPKKPKNMPNQHKPTPVAAKKGSKDAKKTNSLKQSAGDKKAVRKKLRMDVSDSEVEVKKQRKILKSHSSDTEFETSRVRERSLDNKQQIRKKNPAKPKAGATDVKDKDPKVKAGATDVKDKDPKTKAGATDVKDKDPKIKASSEAKDKSQKAGTKPKKVIPKDSLELKEVKTEKTISKRAVK